MIIKLIKSPVSILIGLFVLFFLKFLLIDSNSKIKSDEAVTVAATVDDNIHVDGVSALAGETQKAKKNVDAKKNDGSSTPKAEKIYDYAKLLPSLAEMLKEHAVGNDKAQITIHVFSAYTCTHCATFFKKTIPQIIDNEVKDGKVRIVFEEYPTNKFAAKASLVSRCSSNPDFLKVEERTYLYSDRLYNKGAFEEAMASDKDIGLTREQVDACLNYSAYRDEFKKMVDKRSEPYTINATPTLVYRKSIRTYTESGAVSYNRVKEVVSLLMENKTPAAD